MRRSIDTSMEIVDHVSMTYGMDLHIALEIGIYLSYNMLLLVSK